MSDDIIKRLNGSLFQSEDELVTLHKQAATTLTEQAAEIAELREALTGIERLYYTEGKDAGYRAAHMNGIARAALGDKS